MIKAKCKDCGITYYFTGKTDMQEFIDYMNTQGKDNAMTRKIHNNFTPPYQLEIISRYRT